MLIAELKGKIPSSLVNSEDLVTSSVFGTLQYVSMPSYIQKILESSVNIHGARLQFRADLLDVRYEFWPRLKKSEPDVLLFLQDKEGDHSIICIEAKFWSGKSSEEDTELDENLRKNHQRDQLAREIEDIHDELCHQLFSIEENAIKKRQLIYLTNDSVFPFESVQTSVKYIQGIDYPITDIYWLSWSEIYHIIQSFTEYHTYQDEKILTDLKHLLERKNLASFRGFQHHLKPVSKIDFHENLATNRIDWSSFKKIEKINWTNSR